MRFNRRKMEDERRRASEKEAARRANDAPLLEDAECLIAVNAEMVKQVAVESVRATRQPTGAGHCIGAHDGKRLKLQYRNEVPGASSLYDGASMASQAQTRLTRKKKTSGDGGLAAVALLFDEQLGVRLRCRVRRWRHTSRVIETKSEAAQGRPRLKVVHEPYQRSNHG